MKKYLTLLLLPVLLFSCGGHDVGRINENKEPSTNFTNEQLMVIYTNGYLKGKINALSTKSDKESDLMWQIDSANMSHLFFKMNQ